MKKHKVITCCAIMTLALTSCSNDVVTGEEQSAAGELVTVTLSVDGSAISTDSQTRATSTSDVYGINVYYDSDKDGVCEAHYAYGLFNNKDDMTITLISSYKYKFVCTLVKDATNQLYCGSGSQMAYPFQTNSSTTCYVENKFVYGTDTYLNGLGSGSAHLASVTSPSSSNATSIPSVNRFYGERDNYSPKSNDRVTIEMKRTVFGAKFVITGVTEGSVSVTSSFWNKTTSADFTSDDLIYCYNDVYNCWLNEPNLEYTISINYHSDSGKELFYSGSQTVTFKRNVMTTVYINFDPDTFTITEEPLDEDNNIDIGLNANGLIDVIVDPQEE